MVYDSDDDSLPLVNRIKAGPSHAQKSDDEDAVADLPAWAKSFNSPYTGGYKPPPLPSSSDDDLLDLTKDNSKPAGDKVTAQDAAGPSSQPQPAASPAKGRKRKVVADTPSEAPTPGGSKQAARAGRGKAADKAKASEAGVDAPSSQAGPSHASQEVPPPISTQPSAPVPMQLDSQAIEVADLLSQGTHQPEHSSLAGPSQGGSKPKAGGRGKAGQASQSLAPGAELPVMLPDKLPRNKVLVELCAGDHEDAVDLAGDAGAVGRILVTGQGDGAEMTLDLKGIMYQASVLPLQGSALVLNVQASEARVEAVLNDFIRLTDQGGGWGLDEEGGGGLAALLGSDDEDHYTAPKDGGGEDDEGKGKGKGKKAGGKKTTGKTKDSKAKGKTKASGVKKGGVKKPRKAAGGSKTSKAGTKKNK